MPPDDLHATSDDLAEIRRWSQRASAQAEHAPANTAEAVRRRLVDVPHAVLDTVRTYGPGIAERFGISTPRQFAEALVVSARESIRPDTFYRLQLFRPERFRRQRLYVDASHAERVLRLLLKSAPRDDRRLFNDKRLFNRWCDEHGLPSIPSLGEITPAEGGSAVRRQGLPAMDLFSKPTNWQGGQGAHRWVHSGDGAWIGPAGRVDHAGLIGALERQAKEIDRAIVVQPRVRNHEALRDLTSGALATLRIVTYRMPGGEPELLHAALRMPVGEAITDNFDGGGLAAAVEPHAGRLRAAVRKSPEYAGMRFDEHPDTGGRIDGRAIPFWSESLALVLGGHAMQNGLMPFVGWDVAVTDDGPVLVEANTVPCTLLLQMTLDRPAGETPYVPCLAAYLRTAARAD